MSATATVENPPAYEHLDLLGQARTGDPDAFGELCRLYEGRLLRQAMSLSGHATTAEELAQETLVEAWRSLKRYNGQCQFFTWLCAILLNRYRKAIRQKRRWAWLIPPARDSDEFQNTIANVRATEALPDQAAEARDLALELRHSINQLPVKQQQVIYLRFYVDDSLEAIAVALGCSVGTVKSRLFHALDKLRHMNRLCRAGVEGK